MTDKPKSPEQTSDQHTGEEDQTSMDQAVLDRSSTETDDQSVSSAEVNQPEALESQDTPEQVDAQPLHEEAVPSSTDVPVPEPESGVVEASTTVPTSETEPDEPPATEQEGSVAVAEAEPAVQPRSGRGIAWLAVIIALLGVGGVGYLYYELVHFDPLQGMAAQQQQMDAQTRRLDQDLRSALTDLRQDTETKLDEASQTQRDELALVTEQVRRNLADALKAAPPSRREWKLAEAEYLMRIANHRVLMEDDAAGALDLLSAADQILQELDDFSLHTVRARLADEIMALRRVRRDDLQGIYLAIESVKANLNELQFAQPVMEPPEPVSIEELSLAERLWESVAEFIRFRTLAPDDTIKPLLAPEEERFLELNLRLALQQAQLAVLERQQDVYVTSLDSAAAWIDGYMRDDAAAQAVIEQLTELVQVDLQRALPDVSGSLNELISVMQTGEGS